MTTVRFADLPDLIVKYQHRLEAVVKQSTMEVVDLAQTPIAKGGRMPVATGYLRNSLISTLTGGTSLSGPDGYILIAGQMKPGDIASFGYSASYARHQEYGTSRMQGRHFVAGAVDQWPAIVRAVVARAIREIG